ncbi:cytidine deaminase-like [Oppia nitens]|uniref:cytidine deaminase-like n=1 Tax=Oppia nitens TaxID=1686743 RepID=UPI0023D98312|nr:cytidine deaminase-like [Oppia nitens]
MSVTTTDLSESVAVEKLVTESLEALKHSYCPYSRFPVGAAVQTIDGHIYRGCNVQNAGNAGSICAERTAIVKAVADGHKQFAAIAISSAMSPKQLIVPCGLCLQFMREFSKDLPMYLVRSDGSYERTSLDVYLPKSFGPRDLRDGIDNGVKIVGKK